MISPQNSICRRRKRMQLGNCLLPFIGPGHWTFLSR